MRTYTLKSEENKEADSLPKNIPTTKPHNLYISLIKSPDTPKNTVGNGRAKYEKREMRTESDKSDGGITSYKQFKFAPSEHFISQGYGREK